AASLLLKRSQRNCRDDSDYIAAEKAWKNKRVVKDVGLDLDRIGRRILHLAFVAGLNNVDRSGNTGDARGAGEKSFGVLAVFLQAQLEFQKGVIRNGIGLHDDAAVKSLHGMIAFVGTNQRAANSDSGLPFLLGHRDPRGVPAFLRLI